MKRVINRAASARFTHQRQAVLHAVQQRPVHLTAAEVYDAVRAVEPPIAFATVYNALHYLVDSGMIAEIRRPDGVSAYDRNTTPHDHVICRGCNRMDDVPVLPETREAARAYQAVQAETGYIVEGHRVEYVGFCPACGAREHR